MEISLSPLRTDGRVLVHELLYPSNSLSEIDTSLYLRALVPKLLRSYGADARDTVALHLDVAPVSVSVEEMIPLGLIVNALVCNAFKHAFPRGRRGNIGLSLANTSGELRLVVRDDGVCIPSAVEPGRVSTIGLQLVTTLAEQLGGALEGPAAEEGSIFTVPFRAGGATC